MWWRLGWEHPGWCGHGKGVLLPAAAGRWQWDLPRVAWHMSAHVSWHLSSMGASCCCQLCRAFPRHCFSGKIPFPTEKVLSQAVLHSVSKLLFQAGMRVAGVLAGAGHRLCPWWRHRTFPVELC